MASNLEIEVIKQSSLGVGMLRLKGTLDIFTYGELRKLFAELDEAVKSRPLVVDVAGLTYISSAGWAVLMTGFKAVQKAGGGAMLCGMSEEIYRVYDVMNVASVLPAANNPLHAAELLQAKGVV